MKNILFGIGVCVLFLLIKIFTPVPTPTDKNTFSVSDKVVNVFEGPGYDVVFKLESDNKYAYINRGLQQGLNIDELNQKLKGKETHFKFIKHWTPLDWNKTTESIASIETPEGEILFDRIN